MVRTYKRKVGSRPYRNYSEEALNEAVTRYERGNLMQLSEEYGIPYVTLYRKINKLHTQKPGRSTALTEYEEKALVRAICTASEWGFPFEPADIKDLVENYLNRKGVQLKQFVNNRPGEGWIEKFLNRHKNELSKRLSQSIKQSRAKIDPKTINSYFDNLSNVLENVPPEAVLNYDETNFTDEPGRIKVIVRKQSKRAEKIMDTSKSSTSVMFACSASGILLPPYVVYKSDHLWTTWTEGGPTNASYNRSRSGWFDTNLFEDWFSKIAVPYFNSLPPGRKVLIGDNLATHISVGVIRSCEENNICFVLLPPNSTHLCQPLDVSIFKPIKSKWRQVLRDWKKHNKGVIRKDIFPRLLKRCLESVNSENNIRSGFEATGIVPINRQKILSKLPKDIEGAAQAESMLGETIKELFQEARFGRAETSSGGRKKKLSVEPGKSIRQEDIEHVSSTQISKNKPKANIRRKSKRKLALSHSESDEDILPSYLQKCKDVWSANDDSDNDPETFSDLENQAFEDEPSQDDLVHDDSENSVCEAADVVKNSNGVDGEVKCGDYVVVNLKTESGTFKKFVAEIISPEENGYTCKFLRPSLKIKNSYVYPDNDDIGLIERGEIIKKLTIKEF